MNHRDESEQKPDGIMAIGVTLALGGILALVLGIHGQDWRAILYVGVPLTAIGSLIFVAPSGIRTGRKEAILMALGVILALDGLLTLVRGMSTESWNLIFFLGVPEMAIGTLVFLVNSRIWMSGKNPVLKGLAKALLVVIIAAFSAGFLRIYIPQFTRNAEQDWWERKLKQIDVGNTDKSELLQIMGEPDKKLAYPSSEIQKLPFAPYSISGDPCVYKPCHEYWYGHNVAVVDDRDNVVAVSRLTRRPP